MEYLSDGSLQAFMRIYHVLSGRVAFYDEIFFSSKKISEQFVSFELSSGRLFSAMGNLDVGQISLLQICDDP